MQSEGQPNNFQPEGDDHFFIRHSKSGYRTIKEIVASTNPEQPLDPKKQIMPDLTEEGVELAQREAEKFFSQLNPEIDSLFFVSSNQVRALETANIYREIAKNHGFEILRPKNVRSEAAQEIGEGEIRDVQNLSLRFDNTLAYQVFNPKVNESEINWEALPAETRKKWQQARAIVEADNQSNWGENYLHHSAKVQELFPEIQTAERLYETQFKNLLKLLKFGVEKIKEAQSSKKIKILAFGHENYISYIFDKEFRDKGIANCEAINFRIEGDKIIANVKGQEGEIN